jgi:uncharacterized protein (DUF1697 family)
MTRWVAMLRGVNVGGNQGVPMAELRVLAEALSLGSPRTLLQSGNLVFSSEGQKPADLERLLEAGIADRIGVKTEVCVRSAAEWDRIVGANPFPEAARTDPAHLLLMAFKTPPRPDAPEVLAEVYKGPERVTVAEGHAFVVYPEGVGQSKLTPALLGKHLGKGTARNWNTVLKLQAMLAQG